MRCLWPVILLGIVGAGCTLTSGDTTAYEPTVYPLREFVRSCGGVIQAAINQPPCDLSDNTVCVIAADYRADQPNDNLISNTFLGAISDNPRLDGTHTASTRLEEDGVMWRSYTVRAQLDDAAPEVTLVTVGEVTLHGLTPRLNTLTLETAATSACGDAPTPMLLIQSEPDSQTPLTINGAQVTVGVTAAVTALADDALALYALDGLSVLSARGVTRVVRAGEWTSVGLEDLTVDTEPAPAVRYTGPLLGAAPINRLPDAITNADLPANTPLQQVQAGNCTPNANWQNEHTIQRGETLTSIAPAYGLTPQQLQVGNCVTNPNRLQPGTVLNVPDPIITPTPIPPTTTDAPPPSVTPDATVTAIPASPQVAPTRTDSPLVVDAINPIAPGDCTYISWNIPPPAQVFFDERRAGANDGREVCPDLTTVYTLRVVYPNGSADVYTAVVPVR